MPLIILGVIVIIAVVFIFNSINSGVKRRSDIRFPDFKEPVEEEDTEDGKVIFLFDEETQGKVIEKEIVEPISVVVEEVKDATEEEEEINE